MIRRRSLLAISFLSLCKSRYHRYHSILFFGTRVLLSIYRFRPNSVRATLRQNNYRGKMISRLCEIEKILDSRKRYNVMIMKRWKWNGNLKYRGTVMNFFRTYQFTLCTFIFTETSIARKSPLFINSWPNKKSR